MDHDGVMGPHRADERFEVLTKGVGRARSDEPIGALEGDDVVDRKDDRRMRGFRDRGLPPPVDVIDVEPTGVVDAFWGVGMASELLDSGHQPCVVRLTRKRSRQRGERLSPERRDDQPVETESPGLGEVAGRVQETVRVRTKGGSRAVRPWPARSRATRSTERSRLPSTPAAQWMLASVVMS